MSGESFVKLPRAVLESVALRSLGINARRLLDFLMIEHARHSGKANGSLLAPWRQLVAFGIGDHYIESAILDLERAGLVDCRHGVGKRPNVYALTWLPLSDGTVPSHRWRHAVMPVKQQARNMPANQQAPACQTAGIRAVVPANQQATTPQKTPAKQQALYRTSTTAKPKHGRRADNYAQPEAPDDVPVRLVER